MSADAAAPESGQCRCGELRFEVGSRPSMTLACHCVGCQRMTGSAFSLGALYKSRDFRVLSGELRIGGNHGASRHYFCSRCLSWVFTRPEGMDDFVAVRATLLDGARSFTPFLETWTEEKLPWAQTPAVHSFRRLPPPRQFPALLAEFAERSAP